MVKIFILLCTLADADRAWIESAVEAWRVTSRDALHLRTDATPELIFFDQQCTWSGGETGRPHHGKIELPDGGTVPPQVTSFAASHEGRAFLVMSLPSVWREVPRHAADAQLELLTRAVFVHEMTHTAQMALHERIGSIITRHGLPSDEIDDDIVQKKFGTDAALRAAYEVERDLFYQAARTNVAAERRSLLQAALEKMRERRARFLSGEKARYAELEDAFLFMEGVANWAAFREVMRTMPKDEAIPRVRSSGRWWTQDEGLAIFLAIDAALPDWQALAFSENPPTLDGLIELAAKR